MRSEVLMVVTLVILMILNCPTNIVHSQQPLACKEKNPNVLAQTDDIEQLPVPVREGLELYKAGKINEAIDLWINNMIEFVKNNEELSESREEARKIIEQYEQNRLKIKKDLSRLVQIIGPCKDYIFIEEFTNPDNKFVKRFLLKLKHEQGSLFLEFITIKTSKGEYIIHFHYNTNLPELLKG
jgi:hypothetical protein